MSSNVRSRLLALALALMASCATWAKEAAPAADNPVLEKRVLGLAGELRCLVCQNQTLADSNAPLAVDLRNQIREQLRQGASEREVVQFMTERYGDFVLYRPPLKAGTALLWLGPFVLLALGGLLLVRHLRRRSAEPASAEGLSPAELQRAQRLLDEAGGHP